MPDGDRVTTGSEPRRERRWRTQTHTIPAQVGGAIECYGLGVYPGPIAYLAVPSWADDDEIVPHVGLLPGQVDALLNALRDARLCFEENGDPRVVEPGHDEQTEDDFTAITGVLSQSPWFRDGPPHDLAPLARAVVEVVRKRTVTAVVEALREEARHHSPDWAGNVAGSTVDACADFIAERFNLSPNQGPGGTDGQ